MIGFVVIKAVCVTPTTAQKLKASTEPSHSWALLPTAALSRNQAPAAKAPCCTAKGSGVLGGAAAKGDKGFWLNVSVHHAWPLSALQRASAACSASNVVTAVVRPLPSLMAVIDQPFFTPSRIAFREQWGIKARVSDGEHIKTKRLRARGQHTITQLHRRIRGSRRLF
jgi:hypothetical protein